MSAKNKYHQICLSLLLALAGSLAGEHSKLAAQQQPGNAPPDVPRLQALCTSGNARSCFELASQYRTDNLRSVIATEERTDTEALRLYGRGCDLGYDDSCIFAADFSLNGKVIPMDHDRAAKYVAQGCHNPAPTWASECSQLAEELAPPVISNEELDRRIHAAFANKPELSSGLLTPLSITSDQGAAILTGSVKDDTTRTKIENLVATVPGVKKVVDGLTVGHRTLASTQAQDAFQRETSATALTTNSSTGTSSGNVDFDHAPRDLGFLYRRESPPKTVTDAHKFMTHDRDLCSATMMFASENTSDALHRQLYDTIALGFYYSIQVSISYGDLSQGEADRIRKEVDKSAFDQMLDKPEFAQKRLPYCRNLYSKLGLDSWKP